MSAEFYFETDQIIELGKEELEGIVMPFGEDDADLENVCEENYQDDFDEEPDDEEDNFLDDDLYHYLITFDKYYDEYFREVEKCETDEEVEELSRRCDIKGLKNLYDIICKHMQGKATICRVIIYINSNVDDMMDEYKAYECRLNEFTEELFIETFKIPEDGYTPLSMTIRKS